MSFKKNKIYRLRKDYGVEKLTENSISKNPFKQFETWMNLAFAMKADEPNAMNLSTVDENGKPSSRIVLLRGFDENGFVFYTNYLSRKGHELMANPYACLNFFWQTLEKQVRIEGTVKKIPKTVSDAYFESRPRESQIAAWVSHQSSMLNNREELEHKMEKLTQKFTNNLIPRPAYWGGYCLKPEKIEFWQGRLNRLHDRILYEKIKGSNWKIVRLSP